MSQPSTTTPTTSDEFPYRYTAALAEQIELRWQDEWERRGTFWTPNPGGRLTDADGKHADPAKRSYFVMDMFPYPSGKGLHVGHPLGYIATDVVGRFRRMRGDNVLHAMGFDAFGLPAEQHAVATGQHPRVNTEANIAIMRDQLRRLGLAHDPRRSFMTIDDAYVRWTQWIFLQIFNAWYDPDAVRPDGGTGRARPIADLESALADGTRPVPDVPGVPSGAAWADLDRVARARVLDAHRLAYLADTPVNWAPGLGTVLANEEVTADGRSERGNVPVFKKNLRQWNMRITAYADRLIDDLATIDWPDKVKSMQRHWIGRSTGATVRFDVVGGPDLDVFTTRPDTLFGATFMVVAPEHPLLDEVPATWPDGTHSTWTGGHDHPSAAVAAYRAYAAGRTAVERQADAGRKTGVFTGHLAVNPVTGVPLPVFTADYVLMGYGTGAIMAVPGGDERDYEFALAYDLPVVYTVDGEGEGARTDDGTIINSAHETLDLNGMDVPTATQAMIAWLAERGAGRATVTFRLRDWLFSRQRYWGEPFPVVYDADGVATALPESMLPVSLPDVPDYSPRLFDPDDAASEPEAPLGRNDGWVDVTLDLGDGPQRYRRETSTMPNWAGSCWYYLRYLDPQQDGTLVDPELDRYWLGPGHGHQPDGSVGGVDLYVGGVEHAVLHLLYARFWHK
ncbi:MAG: class I tRNA ligase family protein, partial [Cellulomonas sp.]|nr:class I tRNA ligase family protein [Cellulomonas sp.]